MPHKVIVCRRFQEYQGAASVVWNHEALEAFMLEVQGLPFTLDANNMIRANYQLNKTRYSDSIFCSELVAEAYQRAGIFTQKPTFLKLYTQRLFFAGAHQVLAECFAG